MPLDDRLDRMAMENPWATVPDEAPFVPPCDRLHVEAFNDAYPDQDVRLAVELPPDPWLGLWEAPVVMLQMNPSVGPGDDETYARPEVRFLNRYNLIKEPGDIPHYWLDPSVEDTYAGRWWQRTMRHLIDATGIAPVRNGVLVLEFHGYHAPRHQALPVTLPTQAFGFELLRAALSRDAVVIMNRALRPWRIAVPELGSHRRVVLGTNPRASNLSPGCLGPDGFELVVEAIRNGR